MPSAPKDEKRPADETGNASNVARTDASNDDPIHNRGLEIAREAMKTYRDTLKELAK